MKSCGSILLDLQLESQMPTDARPAVILDVFNARVDGIRGMVTSCQHVSVLAIAVARARRAPRVAGVYQMWQQSAVATIAILRPLCGGA